ncbi:MAG: hypothetical protein A3I44_00070 [Candidatus Sungbacteria bacterium RIFCSPLOWO2_02_FULL_51_17]|uniref:Response regulatory domain-containing protein n=1 Tax=Candidatus Sungbacteria bacterium RIFCSPHIGHO2_02_FULL_51_29 TaxID=1802273 RepID=A0A1G2KR73_9BACT|nr:MAG: hypothetical protein A2676_05505 [Candidatus Sungbacteria bacterium RIFCSPHIGHO2_01_FULL_51_22]OHA01774.1 MAG: hypothetical protein A3C16_02710 [Candidatus Sungbacteria bacterium RIFCSPHIGHO2_02_FULL_51_29]OHA07968.1 MAG: hypothetical protein A3B29_04200 [Candidatus Sungbacteria bacterium RIFCSPLOWO2_01_FULL_51_34]OHA11552.1 MAG: hypothetical protein A3I44_00070 [Candidatus Sungbacteria bacterium RIFCSPLOWO2_02_FULL_51_17]
MAKKILFAEDEPALQRALSESLREAGFAVVSALDGEAACAKVVEEKPDLILLDLILPKKDGFEVLRTLKNNPSVADIPVIVLTNLEGTTEAAHAIELGAVGYLIKTDYRLDELVEKVKEAVGK